MQQARLRSAIIAACGQRRMPPSGPDDFRPLMLAWRAMWPEYFAQNKNSSILLEPFDAMAVWPRLGGRMNSVESLAEKAKTGIWGLDNILSGGFSRGHVFLVEGVPGTGKTTVALQFLLEGAKAGEKCLYIALSETERELRDGATSHGWALDDQVEVFELLPPESLLDSEQQQSLLYSLFFNHAETTE